MRCLATTAALASALIGPAAAQAETTHVVDGAGFGHGVGLSQYGAFGLAEHGEGYRDILGHYYTGTTVGNADPSRTRVLLQASRLPGASFTKASRVGGVELESDRRYEALPRDSGVEVRSEGGKLVARFSKPVRVRRPDRSVRLLGTAMNERADGRYRGKLELRPGLSGGVTVVNVVEVEDYLRGVVPNEMPASWPLAALKAQAVAARGYALTTGAGSSIFDHYPDARSQVYAGRDGEQPESDHAVKATAGRVVRHEGELAETYFFSTSGGRTESSENSFYGPALAYLRAVDDPYDDASPYHRWTRTFSHADMASRLSGLYRGELKQVEVLERGDSPRVVSARIDGTNGNSIVNGTTLKFRLDLPDAWARFERMDAARARASKSADEADPVGAAAGGAPPPRVAGEP